MKLVLHHPSFITSKVMQRFTGLFIFGFIGIVVLGAIVGGVYFVFADFSPSGNPNSITLSSTSNVAEYKGFKISLAPDQVSQGFTVTLNSLAAADFQKIRAIHLAPIFQPISPPLPQSIPFKQTAQRQR